MMKSTRNSSSSSSINILMVLSCLIMLLWESQSFSIVSNRRISYGTRMMTTRMRISHHVQDTKNENTNTNTNTNVISINDNHINHNKSTTTIMPTMAMSFLFLFAMDASLLQWHYPHTLPLLLLPFCLLRSSYHQQHEDLEVNQYSTTWPQHITLQQLLLQHCHHHHHHHHHFLHHRLLKWKQRQV